MYVVYKHICPNDKIYIGITGNGTKKRWSNGLSAYSNNQHFCNAIKKYGWDNVKHEILFEGLTKDEACQKEIELIAKYQSNNPNFGYNLSSGGECKTQGCCWTEQHKQKTRAALIGHAVSESTRKKIKQARANQQNVTPPPSFFGKHNNRAKSVIARLENGETIVFETVKEASQYFGVCHQSISDCCRGKLKTVKKTAFEYRKAVV